jgi:hypothetical protein
MTTSVTGCRTLVFDGDAVRFKGRLTRERKDVAMPVFMIERRFADQLDVTADSAAGINRINDEEGVRWLYSFLSADKRKTYCLYEAPSAEAIRRAAERAGLPADAIVEVTDTIHADGSKSPV